MSDTTKTRKAVVTTAQVQQAVNDYTQVVSEISGQDRVELDFDKGFRGKGFAVYNGENVVTTFDTKEDALDFYADWVKVAKDVVVMIADRKLREAEAGKTAPKAPRKVAAKVVEGSQEGDK